MKKYIKPAIEEHAMGATMPLMLSDIGEEGGRQRTSGMKDKGDDEDDNGFSSGW